MSERVKYTIQNTHADLHGADPFTIRLRHSTVCAVSGPYWEKWRMCLAGLSEEKGTIEYSGQKIPLSFSGTKQGVRADFPAGIADFAPQFIEHETVRHEITNWCTQHNKKQRLDAIIHSLHLGELLKYKCSDLSGFERVRVALGRAALIAQPILVVSGSVQGFSPEHGHMLATALKKLGSHFGLITLWRTERPEDIQRYADTLLWAYANKKPPKKLVPQMAYEKPSSRDLLFATGDAVIIKGLTSQTAETVETVCGSFIAENWCKPNQEVDLALRPENIEVIPGSDGFIMNRQHAGRETWLRIELVDGQSVRLPIPTEKARSLDKNISLRVISPHQALVLPHDQKLKNDRQI